jgi:hypothetical protein
VRRTAITLLGGLLLSSCGDGGQAPETPVLVFLVQPSPTISDQIITPPIQVALVDESGAIVTTRNDAITLRLAGSTTIPNLSGTLTVAAVSGVATFSDVRVGVPGNGYILQAGAPGLVEVPSDPFDILPHPGGLPPGRSDLGFRTYTSP